MEVIKVKIVNKSANPLPSYETPMAAGMDVRANLTEDVTLKPLERKLIPTGILVELPNGYEAEVRPRSGLALKMGITCLNSPGTIDADFRGEIKVLLINFSNESQTIRPGDRIAQMVINSVAKVEWHVVDEIGETERGGGGFGHTGHK